MKKQILFSLSTIALGFFLGEFLFGNKLKMIEKLRNSDSYYFLQEGVYSNKDNIQNNLKDLTEKVIDYKNNKYYVYVGITKEKEIANKLKEIYEKKGYKIYQEERNVTSKEFSENVTQFDLLLKNTEEENQILTIEKIVLSNYEEILEKD